MCLADRIQIATVFDFNTYQYVHDLMMINVFIIPSKN